MAKRNWGDPSYKGRPSPQKAANIFVLVLIIILLSGFIKVGLRENWFEPMICFMFSC